MDKSRAISEVCPQLVFLLVWAEKLGFHTGSGLYFTVDSMLEFEKRLVLLQS